MFKNINKIKNKWLKNIVKTITIFFFSHSYFLCWRGDLQNSGGR